MGWQKIVQTGMLALVVWIGLAANAWAARPQGLYEALIPVKSLDQSERLDIYAQAMTQVLIKLTGDRRVGQNPALTDLLSRANQLVLQYRYRDLPVAQAAALKDQGYSRMLAVEFDGEAVTRALVKARLPLWGRVRPQYLLWLAVDEPNNRYLLGANSGQEIEYYVNNAAWMRGLPVMLPLLDLEDQARLKFADVWGDFEQLIMDASRRYGADGVVVGRLSRLANGTWQARWSWYEGGTALRWSSQGQSASEIVATGIDEVADNVGRRMAQATEPGTGRQLRVTVNDVNSLAGYARVRRYFESLDVVEKVQVSQVTHESLLLNLVVRGDETALKQVIALGSTLAAVNVPAAAGSADGGLVFRLMP